MTASARLQTLSLFSGYGVAGVFWGSFAASTPAFQATTGLGAGAFGIALGVMTLSALPVMRLFGRIIHRIQAIAIPLCLLVFALGSLTLALATSLPVFVIALILLGGASGALDIALNMRTARIEEDTRARLFNRTHALFPFAMLLASAATGLLREQGVAPGGIFPFIAVAFLIVAALERHAGAHQAPAPDTAEKLGPMPFAGPVAILAVIAALAAFQEMSAQSWAAIFVETVRGAAPALSGLAPAAFTLGLSMGRLTAHALETRLTPMATLRAAAMLAIPAFLGVALLGPIAAVLPALFLAGFGVGPVEPAVFRSITRRVGEAGRGRALATVTSVAYLGYLASPPVLGQIAAYLGWNALWATSAIGAFGVAMLSYVLVRKGA